MRRSENGLGWWLRGHQPSAFRSLMILRFRSIATLAALVLPTWLAGCDSRIAPAATAEAARPPVHIDSIIPRDEAFRRFQAGLPEPAELASELTSRDALVRRFIALLEARDTTGLVGLTLNRAEFGYLYYPTNPQSLPPYDLSPGLMWFMMQQNSEKGLSHALEERGGRQLGYVGYECLGSSSHEGQNTIWGPCLIRRVQSPGDTVSERLFGPIIERHGRFKFVNLSNKL